MNKFKEVPSEKINPQQDSSSEKSVNPVRRNKIANYFFNVFSGNFLSKENVILQIPFIFFLMLIGIVYIANGYYAEKSVREISRINNELKELKSEFIITKSELMFMSNQSEVAKSVAQLGLKESTVPPKKIIVTTFSQKKKDNE
ncbi:MAG: FtsL-like putative cell division protein [Bacteroidota bacterium]